MMKYIVKNPTRRIEHVTFYEFISENLSLPTFSPEDSSLAYFEKRLKIPV